MALCEVENIYTTCEISIDSKHHDKTSCYISQEETASCSGLDQSNTSMITTGVFSLISMKSVFAGKCLAPQWILAPMDGGIICVWLHIVVAQSFNRFRDIRRLIRAIMKLGGNIRNERTIFEIVWLSGRA